MATKTKTMKLRGWAPLYNAERSKVRAMLTKQGVGGAEITQIFNALDRRRDEIDRKFKDAIKAHPDWKSALLGIGTEEFNRKIIKIAEQVDVKVHWIGEKGHGHFKLELDGSTFPIFDVEV